MQSYILKLNPILHLILSIKRFSQSKMLISHTGYLKCYLKLDSFHNSCWKRFITSQHDVKVLLVNAPVKRFKNQFVEIHRKKKRYKTSLKNLGRSLCRVLENDKLILYLDIIHLPAYFSFLHRDFNIQTLRYLRIYS